MAKLKDLMKKPTDAPVEDPAPVEQVATEAPPSAAEAPAPVAEAPAGAVISAVEETPAPVAVSAPVKVSAPAPTGPLVYKVRLPGCRVRVVDKLGRPIMKDSLNVAATSTGDAFEKFKVYNGIIGTQSRPEFSVTDEPADVD